MSDSLANRYGLPPSVINSLRHVFKLHPHIDKVILYGSRAKGSYQRGSDIDLCVVGPSLELTEFFEIENQIEELLLPWKIDLSLWHKIDNQALLDHINRVGVTF